MSKTLLELFRHYTSCHEKWRSGEGGTFEAMHEAYGPFVDALRAADAALAEREEEPKLTPVLGADGKTIAMGFKMLCRRPDGELVLYSPRGESPVRDDGHRDRDHWNPNKLLIHFAMGDKAMWPWTACGRQREFSSSSQNGAAVNCRQCAAIMKELCDAPRAPAPKVDPTPRPWRVENDSLNGSYLADADGVPISDPVWTAAIKFLVAAVNAANPVLTSAEVLAQLAEGEPV